MPSSKRDKPNPDSARERQFGKIRKLYRRVLAEAAAVEDGAHPSSRLTDVQVRIAASQAIADGDQSAELRKVLSGRFAQRLGFGREPASTAVATASSAGSTADAADRSGSASDASAHDASGHGIGCDDTRATAATAGPTTDNDDADLQATGVLSR